VSRISPVEALAKMREEGFTYVDVRDPDEFADGHPEGAVNVPLSPAFAEVMVDTFDTDAPIVLGCQRGVRSLTAAKALEEAGFTRVLEQRAGWDGARGIFGELVEPGWVRLKLPATRGS
jgi:rhodanese-related sulfurtransferase